MTDGQKDLAHRIWRVCVISMLILLVLLITSGVCNFYKHTFLSSTTLIAVISFVGTAVIGMATLMIKWKFNEE